MITAKVIADSISESGVRITTLELEYPRFIHAELMTHRMFSRNSASSRAIPIERMIQLVLESPAKPIHWGLNRSGMQAVDELTDSSMAEKLWLNARYEAVKHALRLQELGLHKQIVNRVLEPFQIMKVLVTATDFANFFTLRLHKDAQPEIQELARQMKRAIDSSTPKLLEYGQWHTPYFADGFWTADSPVTEKEALMVSCSCSAQVSYRKLNDDMDTARRIYMKLVESEPVHASAFEHCATPIAHDDQLGITHKTIDNERYSGNFREWVQYRQLIRNHVTRENS